MKDKHIIVLMGGPSAEAEVSRRTGAAIAEALISKGYHVSTLELNPRTVLQDIENLKGDVVFNAIHGRYGEDGALQGALEMAEIPYTGSGIMAHSVGMNKKVSMYLKVLTFLRLNLFLTMVIYSLKKISLKILNLNSPCRLY